MEDCWLSALPAEDLIEHFALLAGGQHKAKVRLVSVSELRLERLVWKIAR
jgi:hypothetical protein